MGLVVATNSVDPANYAGDTELLVGLGATNAVPLDLEYARFLIAVRENRPRRS